MPLYSCRSTYFARALDSLLAVVTLLLDLPVTASKGSYLFIHFTYIVSIIFISTIGVKIGSRDFKKLSWSRDFFPKSKMPKPRYACMLILYALRAREPGPRRGGA